MKILVVGSWQEKDITPYIHDAEKLGRLLAEHGHEFISGPGGGIHKWLIKGYRSAGGKKVIFFLPRKDEMVRVGEKVEARADETIRLDLDYPMRNIIQVKSADALIAITGSTGTLMDILYAAADYDIPVACFDDSGDAIRAVKLIEKLKGKIFYSRDVAELLAHVEREAAAKPKAERDTFWRQFVKK